MKRDLFASSRRCRKARIRTSTISSIVGIILVISSLTWFEGSDTMRNQPTLSLLSIGPSAVTERKSTFEVKIAPEIFGSDARFELPMAGHETTAIPQIVRSRQKPVRLASMEGKAASSARAGKS